MRVLVAMLLAVFVGGSHANQSAQRGLAGAPELARCETTAPRDLGLWDDAFSYEGDDVFILRNGPELFSFPFTAPGRPERLIALPELTGTKIVEGVELNGRRWLFVQSEAGAPFAFDLTTRARVMFELPGVRMPGTHAPVIQSSIIAKHAGGAIFMVSAGDADTWPRPENRPIYYWFGLESGRIIQLPIGWDLLYFSADQRIAVFWKVHGERASGAVPQVAGRPLAAISMATGEVVSDVPDQDKTLTVPFWWEERNDIKPLAAPASGSFAGLSVNGTAYPLDMALEGKHLIEAAQARDERAVFSLRDSGATRPSTLWWVRLGTDEKPRLVGEQPASFEMLGKRFVLYVTSGHGIKKTLSEAFVHDADTDRTWNVLDNVERLQDLDPDIARKDYVEDSMTVRLVRGFGSSRFPERVVSLFSHSRFDVRAAVLPPGVRLPSQRWHRAVLLSVQGGRCSADIPPQDSFGKLWLHNSGAFLAGQHEWIEGRVRLRLSEITIGPN